MVRNGFQPNRDARGISVSEKHSPGAHLIWKSWLIPSKHIAFPKLQFIFIRWLKFSGIFTIQCLFKSPVAALYERRRDCGFLDNLGGHRPALQRKVTFAGISILSKHCLSSVAMVIALIGGLIGETTTAALIPINLRCDQRTNPLGLDNPNPRLSWQLQGSGAARGEVQTAYQIQAGSAADTADLWDSGKVISDQTFDIIYGGQPLTSGQLCFWRVRAYDGSNNVSAWSAPAQWSMGLLTRTNWTAQWIGYDAAYNLTPQQSANNALFNTSGLSWIRFPVGQSQAGVESSLLRKQITLPSYPAVTNAVLALYADNICTAFVNGQPMTNSAMRWEATARINVTPWLHAGTNLFALDATNTDVQEPASVIGQLVVQFASGSVSNYPIDTTWKAAQAASSNWAQTNFNDSSWTTPESTGTPWGTPALNDVPRVPAPYLRKDFTITQTVTRATVYVTALGAYELHLNGQKVGNDVLTPGWTDFAKRVYYQAYDVTALLQPGANCIGAILGDGWYASDLGYLGRRLNYGGTPRLLAQLVVQLADGSTQTIVSDGSWKASYGPILYGDLLIGSGYDARMEIPGWDTTNFSNTWSAVATGLNAAAVGYTNVTALVAGFVTNNQLNIIANNATLGGDPAYGIVKTLQIIYRLGNGSNQTASFAEDSTVSLGTSGQTLTIIQALYGDASRFPGNGGLQVQAAVTEASRSLETVAAVNLGQPAPGCYTFDLGQNMVGWVRLNISGHVGDRITIRHGEMLNPNGTIYAANLRGANSTDFYTFATNGSVVYEPRFTFHGFRYVELRGLSVPPTINSVTGVVVHSDLPPAGSFLCSSPLVNQLYSNIIWGQKGNYLEVPTDCPQRDERLGWTGDTEFFVPTAAYNFDVQSFFHRHLVTLCEDSQHGDGSFANVAPDVGAGGGAAAWGDAAWICTDVMYRSYGDTNVITDHYASFQKYGQFLNNHATNFTIPSLPGDFGDWLNLGGGASPIVVDTAFYAYYAQAMSEMASAIGRTNDAATYAALSANIAGAFANFFNADGAFADGSSQTGYALALTLNLVPDNLRAHVTQQLANSIAQFGNHLATGFIGTPRLLLALHLAGRDDLAYTLLMQQTYPSWLYQVNLGATTMWERWDGWTPGGGFQSVGMNSFNHYAFGSVGQYLYSVVGGINSGSPGYKFIIIQPVPKLGLTWANASYNSIRGPISTAWTNTGNTFNLSVAIPPNTMAQVFVPTTNAVAITESGVPAAGAAGVTYLGISNGCALYSVGSGSYLWSSPYTIPVPPEVIITTTNQTGSGSGTFYPSWTVVTNGSLIAGKLPSAASGNFSEEASGRSVARLTTKNNLGLTQIPGSPGYPITTSTNYVTCGNLYGAGSSVTYSLTGSALGYNLTNITVYGGWADNGRDQQAYTVYYSTVTAPTNFISLAVINYNPAIASGIQSATRVTLTSSVGTLATNVAAVKFDFTNPASENGYCGYAAIDVFGTPTSLPVPTIAGSLVEVGSSGFVLNLGGLISNHSYQLQSKTNLASATWFVETNFIATQSAIGMTNSVVASPQKFYRVVGN